MGVLIFWDASCLQFSNTPTVARGDFFEKWDSLIDNSYLLLLEPITWLYSI
jgi:hypothetical protein